MLFLKNNLQLHERIAWRVMSNHFLPKERKKGGWISIGKDRRDKEIDSCKNTFNTYYL